MRILASLLLIAIVSIACSGPSWAGAWPDCERLFRNYDRAVLFFDNGTRRGLVLAPQIARTAQRARQAGCVASNADLDSLDLLRDDLRGTLRGESGTPIQRTTLQAGIVSGIVSEVQARSFFGGLGFNVRSQGAPGLGRRIFLGPFVTEGGLAEGYAIARRAGFVAPFVRRF